MVKMKLTKPLRLVAVLAASSLFTGCKNQSHYFLYKDSLPNTPEFLQRLYEKDLPGQDNTPLREYSDLRTGYSF
jgi:hypothetical protein